ncbi:hypothetical protein NC651_006072 [Populus alba x Populus x berolinensis]|nr:hypothetical protein NC651_006072 [Populus alba x Populus x berolinensis]
MVVIMAMGRVVELEPTAMPMGLLWAKMVVLAGVALDGMATLELGFAGVVMVEVWLGLWWRHRHRGRRGI